jgi:hypothetical protein
VTKQADDWKKEYRTGSSLLLGIGGAVFFLAGAVMWRSAPFTSTMFLLTGGYVVLTYLFCANRKMVLTSDDITIDSVTRVSSPTHQVLAWSDITATRYYIRRNARNLYGIAYFEICAGDRKLFVYSADVDQGMQPISDLIAIFNSMATRVPYVWILEESYTQSRYIRIDRSPAEALADIPPPLPSSPTASL